VCVNHVSAAFCVRRPVTAVLFCSKAFVASVRLVKLAVSFLPPIHESDEGREAPVESFIETYESSYEQSYPDR